MSEPPYQHDGEQLTGALDIRQRCVASLHRALLAGLGFTDGHQRLSYLLLTRAHFALTGLHRAL